MKALKNRTVLGLICIILAVVVCFVITPIVNRAASAKTEIVQIVKDIPSGRQITDSDVRVIQVGKYNLPENTIKKKEDAVGKYAICDLKSSEFLMGSKITEDAGNAEEILKSLDGSKQAISMTISSFAAGLSGKLKNGDIISVIQAGKDGQAAVIPPELKYVKVITTTTSSGYDTESQEEKEDQEKELPSTVTLLVNSEQSKLLATLEQNGGIHASLVYRGNTEQANEFLAAQDAVFAEGTGDA